MSRQSQRILLYTRRSRRGRSRPSHHRQQPPHPPPPQTHNDPILAKLEACRTAIQLAQIHANVVVSGLFPNILYASRLLKASVSSALSLQELHTTTFLFSQIHRPDVFCYNLMVRAYSKSPTPLRSFSFYQQFQRRRQLRSNEYTFCFLLDSCSSHGRAALPVGRQVHGHLGKHGLDSGLFAGTSLVNMYGKCGAPEDARRAFDGMPRRNEVSYGAMVGACLSSNYLEEGFTLVREMTSVGVEPSNATLVGVVRASRANSGGLAMARAVHGFVVVRGLELNVTLGTSLVDAYAKHGDVETAGRMFAAMPKKSVASWNCMINGLAVNGSGMAAVATFDAMQMAGQSPNSSTFVAVLNACRHAGMVEEGEKCLCLMSKDYEITPELKHYGCMVDLYGRAGRLRDAVEVVVRMPVEADAVIWMALLEACKIHGQRLVGEMAGAQLAKLLPYDACLHLLFTSAYASSDPRNATAEMKVRKVAACSSIAT